MLRSPLFQTAASRRFLRVYGLLERNVKWHLEVATHTTFAQILQTGTECLKKRRKVRKGEHTGGNNLSSAVAEVHFRHSEITGGAALSKHSRRM